MCVGTSVGESLVLATDEESITMDMPLLAS